MKEMSAAELRRIALEAQEVLFVNLVRNDPVAAGILQPHYLHYLEAERAEFEEHPDRLSTMEDIKRRTPHNLWIEYVTVIVNRGDKGVQ